MSHGEEEDVSLHSGFMRVSNIESVEKCANVHAEVTATCLLRFLGHVHYRKGQNIRKQLSKKVLILQT